MSKFKPNAIGKDSRIPESNFLEEILLLKLFDSDSVRVSVFLFIFSKSIPAENLDFDRGWLFNKSDKYCLTVTSWMQYLVPFRYGSRSVLPLRS